MKLNTQPTANVTIGLSSSDTTEGTVLPTSLTFTSSNWNTPQTVTVTGVDDHVVDGNVAYTIVTAAATSTDANYNGLNAADVSVTNNDNDVANIMINDVSLAEGSPSGTTAFTFTVSLSNPVASNVTVDYATANGTATTADSDYTAASGTMTFVAGGALTQTVTVNVGKDSKVEADETFFVNLSNARYGGATDAARAAITDSQCVGTILNDDTTSPTVTRVLVASSDWSSQFLNSLGGVGYAIPDGPNQVLPLPWSNLNEVIVEFSKNVNVAHDDLTLVGVNVPNYGFSAFSYDAVAYRATWTLSQNLPVDKLLMDLDGNTAGAVVDMAGNRLDGEWTNPTWNLPSSPTGGGAWPSGNGVAGGDFLFRFNVLPGNAHRSGTTDATDLNTVLSYYNQSGTTLSTGDFNGDGMTNATDLNTVLSYYNQSLPGSEPVVASLMASQTADQPSIVPASVVTGVVISVAADEPTIVVVPEQAVLAVPVDETPEQPSADPVPVVTDAVAVSTIAAPADVAVPGPAASTVLADENPEAPPADLTPVATDVVIVSAAADLVDIVVTEPVAPAAPVDQTPEVPSADLTPIVTDVVAVSAAADLVDITVPDPVATTVPVGQTPEVPATDPMPVVTNVIVVSVAADPAVSDLAPSAEIGDNATPGILLAPKYVAMTVDNDPAIIALAPMADAGTCAGQAWMAAKGQVPASPNVPALADLRPISYETFAWWMIGGRNASTIPQLSQVQFAIRETPDAWRSEAQPSAIYHDRYMASRGRFVDPVPPSDRKFTSSRIDQRLQPIDPRGVDRIDLSTVVEHEPENTTGFDDLDALANDVMCSVRGRRLSCQS